MKRLILMALILLSVGAASSRDLCAQVWHPANQVTLAWDAVTTLHDGTAVPAGSVVKYQVYKRMLPATTGEAVGGEITEPSQPVSFAVEGGYYLGVKSLRYVDGSMVGESAIAWTDVAANCANGEAFGVTYWMAPALVKGLRLQ